MKRVYGSSGPIGVGAGASSIVALAVERGGRRRIVGSSSGGGGRWRITSCGSPGIRVELAGSKPSRRTSTLIRSDMGSSHVSGVEPGGDGESVIEALAPAAELQRYATDLRSITQGRGSFTSTFDHYEQVPAHLAEAIRKESSAQANGQAA